MKYLFSLSATMVLISFISCNQNNKSQEATSEISISVDSVVVDSKGEIIDTKYGLHTYGFSPDKKTMYKFNTNNRHGLEVIDLEKMELVDFIPFEVEGPNGTSTRVGDVNYVSDDKISLTNSQAVLVFNMKGELQNKYPISSNEFEGDSIPRDLQMESSGLYVPEKNLSFNLINKGHGYLRGFAKLDLEKNTRNVYWIDEVKKLDDFHISLTMDGRMMMLRTFLYRIYQDGKYILSHDMENELFYYDLESDKITHKEYKSELSANKNEVLGKEVESREEIGKIMSARNKSIRFKKIVFDEEQKRYYRFSTFSTSVDEKDRDWNIILTIFDRELNQIDEIANIPLEEVPETYWVKDGKIYVYKNMEDEMGFVVLTIS